MNILFLPLLESATLHNTPVQPHDPCPYCGCFARQGWHGRTDEIGHPECHTDYTMTDDDLMMLVLS
ncbi:MAG: hypothetical protein ACPG7F_00165 [Aggregatilineales bacterium]